MSFSSCRTAVISRSTSRSICRSRLARRSRLLGEPVLAREHEQREEDRLERDDHRQERERKRIERRDDRHEAGVDRDPCREPDRVERRSTVPPAAASVMSSLKRSIFDRLSEQRAIPRLDRFDVFLDRVDRARPCAVFAAMPTAINAQSLPCASVFRSASSTTAACAACRPRGRRPS